MVATTYADPYGRFATMVDLSAVGQFRAVAMAGTLEKRSGWIVVRTSQAPWDPQRSFWEGTITAGPNKGQYVKYQGFRNGQGEYSTQGWKIPGMYGFNHTHLRLYGCGCPNGETQQITVIADGQEYQPSQANAPWFDFQIGSAHSVQIKSRCGTNEQTSDGQVLIDPDGYVFDIDQGGDYSGPGGLFNPVQAIGDITVTAYVSVPEWGGWVPWPAHLYGQVNPQNTNATYADGITTTGYFAFFTPPGYYYLEAQGANGYQSWRSPVLHVVTEVLHVNIPFTPDPTQAAVTVTLTAEGPQPRVVTVAVGSAVQWLVGLHPTETVTGVMRWMENPVIRPLSERNPMLDPLGFDGGYLEPGRAYRRVFRTSGVYTYTDGTGHQGVVVVQGYNVYLPLVTRQVSVSASSPRQEEGLDAWPQPPVGAWRRWLMWIGVVGAPWVYRWWQ